MIGRSPDCDVFLDDVTVSRKHALLVREAAELPDRRPGQPQRHVRQPASGSSRRRSRTATSCRSASTGSRSWSSDGHSRRIRRARALPHDRGGLPAAERRVPRHLDLEDPLPRGPGAAAAAADARRLPAVQRGGRRAPATILRLQRDEFLPLRVIREELALPTAKERAKRRRPAGAGRRRTTSTLAELCERAGHRARAARGSWRSSGCSRRAGAAARSATRRATSRSRPRARARAVRDRAAPPARVPHAAERETALLEQIVAPALRSRNPSGARGMQDLQGSPSSRRSCRRSLFWRTCVGWRQ